MSSRGTSILLSLLPGWGHIYLGREGQGLLVFTAAAISGFTLLNATLIYLGELRGTLIGIASIATAGLFLYSVGDIFRLTAPLRLQRISRRRDQLLWEGMLAYLRSDYVGAEQKFLECARLDALDVEPVFRAGVAASRRGAWREARRLFNKARKLDIELKWKWELEEELQRVNEALQRVNEALNPEAMSPADAPARKQ